MALWEEIENSFEKYKKALTKLEEALNIDKVDEIVRDATIQRFEFTFEMLWKLIKKFAYMEKLECYSPKTCFKIAFQMGLIKEEDEEIFIDMIDYRNVTTHTYNEEMSKEVYNFIKNTAIKRLQNMKLAIENYLKEN